MKITKQRLKDLIKEELENLQDENEGDVVQLATAALANLQSKYPEGDRIRLGTEYGVVDKILNKLIDNPSEDNMTRLINVAGSGRPGSSKITLTAEDIGYPLLNAIISKLGDNNQIFNTPKGRYAKTYRDRLGQSAASDLVREQSEVPDEYLEWWLKNGGKDLDWYGGSLGSTYGPKYMARMWKDSKKWEEFFAAFPKAKADKDIILKISTEFLKGGRNLKPLQPPVDLDKAAERVSFIMSYNNTQNAEATVDRYLAGEEAKKKGLDPEKHRDEILNRVKRLKK